MKERLTLLKAELSNFVDKVCEHFDPEFSWSTIVQVIGFLLAIWTVKTQLAKQRELQSDVHKVELQRDIYEKITSNIETCSPSGVAAKFAMIPDLLRHSAENLAKSGRYVPPHFVVEDIDDYYQYILKNLYQVIANIERYEVALPHLPLFRMVLMQRTRELSDSYIPLIQAMPYLLFSREGNQDSDALMRPDEEELLALEGSIRVFTDAAYDVAAYLHDIQVELQNELLGKHFDNKLAIRSVKSNGLFVLTSSDGAMLEMAKEYLDDHHG